MKKTLLLILTTAILILSLTACGGDSTESSTTTNAATTGDNVEITTTTNSVTRIVPTSFDGIYVNDSVTHYVIIEGDYITIDDKAGSSISVKENDAVESTVYAFSYDGKEETFFDGNGSFMCSIGAEEGIHYCWCKVNEVPQLPVEEKGPLWLQGDGSTFEIQLKTDLVTEMKNADEKAMYVNFKRADGNVKMALTISYTDGAYSGYISNNETGDAYNGDLLYDSDGFINFRFFSTIYPLFSDIESYDVALFGGDQSTYQFENCTGGDFTAQTDSTSENEPSDDNTDTLPMVGNIYRQSNGATLEIVHSNSEGCITAVKFDDILLELTNAQCGTDGTNDENWYYGEFDGGVYAFQAIYSIAADSFTEVWFSVGPGDGRTRMEFDSERFMGTYNIESYGDSQSGSNGQNSYSFIGITYKHEILDLTFRLQNPDENGYPTEIVLNGQPYSDEITFNNETYTLENVTMTKDNQDSYSILANWTAKGLEFSLNIYGNKDWWRMYGPGMCGGDYYPQ